MTEQSNLTRPDQSLPGPDLFRGWLVDSIRRVETQPARLSRAAGLSPNAVARILKPGADVHLGTASSLERTLRELAETRGETLPPVPVSEGSAHEL
uniref:hypothetical protein n=1 Tax=Ruegeria arenilitoris TaxID=1173585 RepID=UPI00147ED3EF|nr:hypothetical protein [Ruegeria arenilitoris]